MTTLLIMVIRLYQHTLSPDHGPLKAYHPHGYCRFHPTCSEYAIESLQTHGFFKGIFLSLARLTRCHPWNTYGLDPVPRSKNFTSI